MDDSSVVMLLLSAPVPLSGDPKLWEDGVIGRLFAVVGCVGWFVEMDNIN